MKTTANYGIRVLATGVMVLVLFAIPLYWGRFFSELLLYIRMPEEATRVEVSPSRILPEEIENDPNAVVRSIAFARMHGGPLVLTTLGFVDYFLSRGPGGNRSDVFYYHPDKAWMYFDRSTGQIVFRDTYWEQRDSSVSVERPTAIHYAGPEGVSKLAGEALGRFHGPLLVLGRRGHHILYDGKLHRFFAIDRETMTVKAGPELTDVMLRRPLVVGSRQYHEDFYFGWEPPKERIVRKVQDEEGQPQERVGHRWTIAWGTSSGYRSQYVPVIDASGQVVLLDPRTLELVPAKGTLPVPKTLYGEGSRRPFQLLRQQAYAIFIGPEDEYAGLYAVSVSRQGTSMAMSIFDKDGSLVTTVDTRAMSYGQKGNVLALVDSQWDGDVRDMVRRYSKSVGSARAALFEVPWAPALTVSKYLLENVHPPALTMASFFLADRIEASASHRTLLLVPNSFAALHRDRVRQNLATQFVGALYTMFPAILLAVFLTWAVARDATVIGLPRHARDGWILGTLAFGLPAYITYRLTRPQTTLVTCANCGQPRRPDMDRCHRCNSPWHVPELVSPAWRVLDGALESPQESDASEKSAPAPEQNPDSSVESM